MSALTDLYLQNIADDIHNGYAGGGSLTVDVSGAGDMQGCDAGTAGVHGLVPAPAAGDQDKYLAGDGTWKYVPSGGGAAPDYTNVIESGTYNQSGWSYTAPSDGFLYIEFSANVGVSTIIYVNSGKAAMFWANQSIQRSELIRVYAGDIVTSTGTSDTVPYILYGER